MSLTAPCGPSTLLATRHRPKPMEVLANVVRGPERHGRTHGLPTAIYVLIDIMSIQDIFTTWSCAVPFRLRLPSPWNVQRWKVKILDRERVEEPHVTIIRGTRLWRLSLRTGKAMDRRPSPKALPAGLLECIWLRRGELVQAWDRLHPENPFLSPEVADD